MAASPKDKFEAAVKVIRGLPKNGSFQPSHELMLKFYSYFKQATEGPCISPRPAFWDLINKKKWEAWTNLGDMRSEEAMLSYVDELKKIVETMPQTDAVTDFLQKLDNFYEMVEDSENQNTLKVIDKPRLNGSVCTNGTADSGDEGDLSSSYRLTQLLKCDVKWWKDSPDTHRGENIATNGHSTRFERTENGGSYGHAASEDEEEENIELNPEKVELNTKKVERMNGREELNADNVQSEEYEQVDESRLSLSHSNSSDESETESEEFCDTSDDPIELSMPTSSHNFVSCLPPLAENTSTSTPSCKSVRFDPRTNFPDQDSADSLLVNASQEVADTSDLTDCVVLQEGTLPLETFSDDGQRSDLDILMCRGGEEQDSERRRRGGGQGSREGSSSASRGGRSAGGGNSGAEGHRNLYPGPGGGGGWRGPGAGGSVRPTDLNEQIMVTLLRLQHDMSGVLNRLNSLEALVKEQRKRKDKEIKTRGWWPFPDLSVQSTIVIFAWPLLVHCIIAYIRRRHRKLNR